MGVGVQVEVGLGVSVGTMVGLGVVVGIGVKVGGWTIVEVACAVGVFVGTN
jgi:hypothetical protein